MVEKELFQLLKNKIIPDLQKTEGQYSYSDATSESFNSVIELKCRTAHYRYLLIQKDKYDKLMTNENPRYINSIPVYPYDGNSFEVYSWDLKKVPEPRWRLRRCIETTEFAPPNYVMKMVGFLDIKIGKNLTKKLFPN